MKKFSLMTIPFLCTAAMPLFADGMGKNCDAQKNKQHQFMDVTPSSEPAVTRCCDPFITADFIWWKAQEEGLNYAQSGASFVIGTDATSGQASHPSFKFKPGFKVGFGLKFRHDGWDLFGQYTWFHSRASGTTAAATSSSSIFTEQAVMNPFVGAPAVDVLATGSSASTNWKLKFNVIDVELGRGFWISKWLTLRPHFGMKFAWMNQRWNNSFASTTTFDGGYAANSRLKELGVGLRAGLDAQFYMNKYFSIFGDLAASALWNRFKANRTDTATFTGTPSYTALSVKEKTFDITEVLELQLGLRFEYPFHDDDFMWFLQAGWEEQIWFSQNQFIDGSSNNLTFEGLTIKTGFYF